MSAAGPSQGAHSSPSGGNAAAELANEAASVGAHPTAAHARRQLAFPLLFVVLWSTGFIAAKYGLAYAPPLTFLLYRFVLVAALMGVVALATRAVWPATLREVGHVVIAAWLVHGVYLGGVLVAIASGMSAGMAAMLVGLQPIVTVLLARGWLGERIVLRQWLGLALGLAGVWLVVRHKVAFTADAKALVAILLALAGISVGTLYQKRYCSHVDLRCGAVIQFIACALVYAPIVLAFEHAPVLWTAEFVFALGWAVVVLSVGAISLLYWLLRHGAASNVAGLFFLVPAVTAVMAWLLFGETLDTLALAGMALISVGVALARQTKDPPTP
jgi:drug/metabolite transporter (DMT)-like permease